MMADKPQVVKLAQAGIDVKTAGDDKLVYNSNWPLLKIYKQGSFTTSDINTLVQPIVNHDLGYVPMFYWFANQQLADWYSYAGVTETRSEFNGPIANYPTISDSRFVYQINAPGTGLSQAKVQLYYYIFALDITKPYQAPNIKSGGVIGPRNKNTVFKIAKPGKDISSNNLEDYVVNSLARSPMIHAVYPGVVASDATVNGGKGFTFYHNLGYVPMFFAYGEIVPGAADFLNTSFQGYQLMTPDGSGNSGFSIDEQKIQFFYPIVGKKVSLVILKDPFSIDYSVSVAV